MIKDNLIDNCLDRHHGYDYIAAHQMTISQLFYLGQKMGIQERKEREKEQRREDILNAAEEIFFEKGLALATMDEIAERAELSKGTLYLYYKSKEDLYLAVGLRGGEILYQKFLEATPKHLGVIRRIVALGKAYFAFTRENRDHFRLYQYAESTQLHRQVSEEMQIACRAADRKIWGVVIGILQEGIDEGLIAKNIDPAQAALILWACNVAIIRLMDQNESFCKEQLNVDLDSTLKKANQLVLEGMLTEKGKRIYQELQTEEETVR